MENDSGGLQTDDCGGLQGENDSGGLDREWQWRASDGKRQWVQMENDVVGF